MHVEIELGSKDNSSMKNAPARKCPNFDSAEIADPALYTLTPGTQSFRRFRHFGGTGFGHAGSHSGSQYAQSFTTDTESDDKQSEADMQKMYSRIHNCSGRGAAQQLQVVRSLLLGSSQTKQIHFILARLGLRVVPSTMDLE